MQGGSFFSQELKKLMRNAELKNANVAAILGYDISYVSKWISGGKLPSAKNISELIDTLVTYIVKSVDDNLYHRLCAIYQVSDESNLKEKISTALFMAYRDDNKEKKKGAMVGEKLKCYSTYSYSQLIGDIGEVLSNHQNIVCLINLLDMSRELKLRFLGIRNGYFETNDLLVPQTLYLVFNLDDRKIFSDEDFYNALYLAHLLTRFSDVKKLEIYCAIEACGKVVLFADNYYLASAVVFETSNKCLTYMTDSDKSDYDYVFETIKKILTQEHMLLSRIEPTDFQKTYEYRKVFISSSTKCLIGHIPEFLLPACIAEQIIDIRSKEYESWSLVHNLISKGNNIELLVYETALLDLMLDGRIDVFGKNLRLNIADRIKIVEYLLFLVGNSQCNIRLVLGGFYEDFLHLPNPCIFLSDSFCYLRVDNSSEHYVIYSAIHSSLKKMYHYFFSEAWNNRKDIVLSDKESIIRRLRALVHTSYAISSINGVSE